MREQHSELARQLRAALTASDRTVDELADHTKVPRTTILTLLEEPVSAVSPGRVYLRGHLKVVARALDLDPDAAAEAFEEAYPVARPTVSEPVLAQGRNVAVSAGLYGIALFAVAVAFVSAWR